MVLKSLIFAVFTYILAFVIALAVAGIIKLIFIAVHRSEPKKTEAKVAP